MGCTRKDAFEKIKEPIATAPALISPNFGKEFLLYTFAFDVSYATTLTRKNFDDVEIHISFMSTGFHSRC